MIGLQAQGPHDAANGKIALIALGANLPGDVGLPQAVVTGAMHRLAGLSQGPAKASRLYRTPAFPAGSGPDFVNAALSLPWDDTAHALLAQLNAIEAEFGRTRHRRWEARVLDLDLIALSDTVLPDATTQAHWADLPPEDAARITPDRLILPHPRMAERGFVLVPLADIAPDWPHPVTGATVAAMLSARPDADLSDIIVQAPAPDLTLPDAAGPLSFLRPDGI